MACRLQNVSRGEYAASEHPGTGVQSTEMAFGILTLVKIIDRSPLTGLAPSHFRNESGLMTQFWWVLFPALRKLEAF